MNLSDNPSTLHKPLGKYCHTTLVPADANWLVLSGQVLSLIHISEPTRPY